MIRKSTACIRDRGEDDGAVAAPLRLVMGMMAIGMIVGALAAPDANGSPGAETAQDNSLSAFTSSIMSIFE